MFGIDWLATGILSQVAYILIGLVVAFIYTRRNRMQQSIAESNLPGIRVGNLVYFLLALIWPAIAFAMLIEPKSESKKANSPGGKTGPADENEL